MREEEEDRDRENMINPSVEKGMVTHARTYTHTHTTSKQGEKKKRKIFVGGDGGVLSNKKNPWKLGSCREKRIGLRGKGNCRGK